MAERHSNIANKHKSNHEDYTNYYKAVRENVDEIDGYRGISKKTFQKAGVGFDPTWKDPANPNHVVSPRIIIPCSASSYEALLRKTKETTPKDCEYSKLVVGKRNLFQEEVLRTAERPIGIVEGAFDALSIEEVGGCAISLGGVTMINRLEEAVQKNGTCQPLYLLFDNDEAGQEARDKLAEKLQKIGIPFICAELSGYNDANDALVDDKEGFAIFITNVEQKAKNSALDNTEEHAVSTEENATDSNVTLSDNLRCYSVENRYDKWFKNRQCNNMSRTIPTGFSQLDEALGGGLHEGELVVLGAEPGIGKTTFLLQAADQMANQNVTVLFFSLEMSGTEMLMKQISRCAYQMDRVQHGDCNQAEELVNALRSSQSWCDIPSSAQEQLAQIKHTLMAQNKLFIIDDVLSAQEIYQVTEKYLEQNPSSKGNLVVIIDYLQRLKNPDAFVNERQLIEKNLNEIQSIYIKLKVPVFCISSLNRISYGQAIKNLSFKESGQIEYDASALLGIQQFGIEQEGQMKVNNDRAKNGATIENNRQNKINADGSVLFELVIVKNRHGITGSIPVKFFGKYSYFEESQKKRVSESRSENGNANTEENIVGTFKKRRK